MLWISGLSRIHYLSPSLTGAGFPITGTNSSGFPPSVVLHPPTARRIATYKRILLDLFFPVLETEDSCSEDVIVRRVVLKWQIGRDRPCCINHSKHMIFNDMLKI